MNKKLLTKAIETFGVETQLKKTAEECSELIKAVLKPQTVTDITIEIADVLIMIAQLQIIFGISDRTIEATILEKCHRLEDLIDQKNKNA